MMAKMPADSELYKRNYRRGDFTNCARNLLTRYLEEKSCQISEELERRIGRISPRLAPNQREKVRELFSL
jgi:hypothetical protein